MRAFQWISALAALSAVALPFALCAEDANNIPPAYLISGDDSPVAVYVAASRSEGESDVLGQGVDSSTLADMSGGANVTNTTNITQTTTLTGNVSDDYASHIVSGDNVITGDSLSNATGIPIVIQNSGSNVLIQNATVLNVQFKP